MITEAEIATMSLEEVIVAQRKIFESNASASIKRPLWKACDARLEELQQRDRRSAMVVHDEDA